jgi:hypothetical protein
MGYVAEKLSKWVPTFQGEVCVAFIFKGSMSVKINIEDVAYTLLRIIGNQLLKGQHHIQNAGILSYTAVKT